MPKNPRNKSEEPQNVNLRVITGPTCRATFMRILKLEGSKKDGSGTRTCSTGILIPKKDKKTVKAIRRAIKAAARKKFGPDVEIFKSRKLKQPLHDADELIADSESSVGKESAGCYIMTAKAYKIPQVVDRHNERITDPDELEDICVSGYYFRFSITLKAFDVETDDGGRSRGVRCLLNNLMYLKEGDRLDGGKSAEDDFEGFEEEGEDDDDDGYGDDD